MTQDKFERTIIRILILIGVLVALAVYVFGFADTTGYICSRYGDKCYIEEMEHGNIKHEIKFNNWSDALDWMNK